MLRIPSFLFLFLLLSGLFLTAQPSISFQIRNEVRNRFSFEFDIYARGDTSYSFHNRGQIYLNYSTLAFGDSIVENRKIKNPKHLFLLNELSFIGPKYVTVNYVDNTSSRISITWESNFSGIPPLPGAHTELTPKWTPLYHLEIEMQDTTAEPSITFQNNLMSGQHFYLFDANDERPFRFIPAYPDFFKRAKGRVYYDQNADSVFNHQDIGLAEWIVRASPGPYYALTDSQGRYDLHMDTGQYQIDIFPPRGRADFITYPTSISQTFIKRSAHQNGLDFAVQLDSCPLAEARIFAGEHSFCDTNRLYIQYANRGILPIDSAQIDVNLPEQLSLISSSHAYTLVEPGVYRFDLGSLEPLKGGLISLQDSSTCDQSLSDIGLCIAAEMSPENICTARDTIWKGAFLTSRTFCDSSNRNVYFVIKNEGGADMIAPSAYYITADDSLIYADQTQLQQGDSLRMLVEGRGQSIQLVVRQAPNHPTHNWFSLHAEGCGSPFSTGFVSAYPASDPDYLTQHKVYLDLGAKRDTSATFAIPKGLDSPQFIGDSTELYVGVRFFNPLPNTAAVWINIDSLSPDLDPFSFRPGPLTQAGKLAVYGKGQLILDHYGYNLGQEEEASLFFRIVPRAGTPFNTAINNTAGTCIDTFPPIMSDTLLRTIGIGMKTAISPDRITLNPPNVGIDDERFVGWKIFPNPAQGFVWIQAERQSFQAISFLDMAGRLIVKKDFISPQMRYRLSLPELPAGVYLLKIQTSEGSLVSRISIP